MDHVQEFLKVPKAMEDEEVDYILIGGFAFILHGLPRFTMDMDFFMKMAEKNVQKLRKALYSVLGDSDIDEITFDELAKYPVIRYGTPNGFHIDIMAQWGEAATYEDLEYEIMEVLGQKIRVATAETSLKLKQDTIRPEDKGDALFLKELLQRKKG
jgi:hypothetical protein